MASSYIDGRREISFANPLVWLTTTSSGGHAYMFLEYLRNPSFGWRLFGYGEEHVLEKVDFHPGRSPRVLHEPFRLGSSQGPETLKRLTYHKKPITVTVDQLQQLIKNIGKAYRNPPQYSRYAAAGAAAAGGTGLEEGDEITTQNCSSFLVALLLSIGVEYDTGITGRWAITPKGLSADWLTWLSDTFQLALSGEKKLSKRG